jgi:hypothetical protein
MAENRVRESHRKSNGKSKQPVEKVVKPRNKIFALRLSPEEFKLLSNRARKSQSSSLSAYLRGLAGLSETAAV